ncbi:hypothetical protein [Flagellimonas abyssi]|uniref:Uncharacterized protein n=1 Tax=Flagellimonas abyssi TaxID=2864871 RepID=A0ABS7EUD1_9FLAO|nr:hypothetical protein [Allomuricauda abyssi]MBW8201197.1 hypothetical protein [Allomuricauda abyssi]
MKRERLMLVILVVVVPLMFAASLSYFGPPALAYLGQDSPTMTPKIFAPGVISQKDVSEFGSVFNQEGTELFYGVDLQGRSEIRYTYLKNGEWTKPVALLSDSLVSYNDPFLSPDEDRLYFISNYSGEDQPPKSDYDMLYIKRGGKHWETKVYNVGPNINTDRDEYYMSFDERGTVYFSSNFNASVHREHDFDIYASSVVDGDFQPSILLDEAINTNAYEADVFVAPDASYILFCGIRDNGYGQGDLYISFKDEHDNWTKAVNMGDDINTGFHELCPFVTKDGQYLFFTRNQDIYWVDADIIEKIRAPLGRSLIIQNKS